MAGIYLHIPFCKQACHYCDFHFSTSLKNKEVLVAAICRELALRKEELSETVTTIYFGGGTPSLLSEGELQQLFDTIFQHFQVVEHPEITLEANPDDLTSEKIRQLAQSPINRLSIGVQSFFESDLKLMNRAHTVSEATHCITEAQQYFENITIDLIYGIPEMTTERWLQNLEKAFQLNVPHLSCYALTVEPKTALKTFIEKGIVPPVEDEVAKAHHELLISETKKRGYTNYEFSNFGKPGYESQNNLAYWQGKPYLGVGPSAHSYTGSQRSWNVPNNTKYLKAISEGQLPLERETLSVTDRYNEYVMTRLRTQWGINLEEITAQFGTTYQAYAWEQAQEHLEEGLLEKDGTYLRVSAKGKFLSDGIASDLFLVNLK